MTPEFAFINPLMPQPIDCDRCGANSRVHSAQYVYQRTNGAESGGDGGHPEGGKPGVKVAVAGADQRPGRGVEQVGDVHQPKPERGQ